MRTRKVGNRHPILFYRRTMDRIWKVTLLLGLVLLAVWGWSLVSISPIISQGSDYWIVGAAVVCLIFALFALLARRVAYVQVHGDHLSVVTPFLRLKISFRRIHSVHPVLLQQLFPPQDSSWAQKKYLEPFYGKTVVVVVLRGYPISPILLRLFLPAQMFSPRSDGFVFLVPDWMEFSTEFDSFQGSWLQTRARSQNIAGGIR